MKAIAYALFCLPLVVSCGEPPADLPDRVIDAHLHADFADSVGGEERGSRAALEQEWSEARVVGAVVHLPRGSAVPPVGVPGRVRYCAGVDAEPDLAGLEAALQDGTIACIKIYLGYVHRYASDPSYQPVYQLAARFRVPVVFHTGDTADPSAKLIYADPLTVDEVAVDHRDVTFVIAHCGNPWIESAAEVAYKNPNVYLECSAMMTGDMDELPAETVARYVTDMISWVFGYLEDPGKLMFGSDWPLVSIPAYVRAYARAIPREHWDAVFYGNAARVFGFEQTPTAP
jgi:predicted TIM-barrel fold metal-dependent hydrolase